MKRNTRLGLGGRWGALLVVESLLAGEQTPQNRVQAAKKVAKSSTAVSEKATAAALSLGDSI